jgi:MFS family permease
LEKQNVETEINKSAKSNFGGWGWGHVGFTFFTLMFAGFLLIDSQNIVLGAFNALRGWNTGVLLSFSAYAGLVAIAGAALLGRWVVLWGSRVVFIVTLLIVTAAVLFWGHVTALWQFALVVGVINVFGNGFGFIASTNLISNWFPRKKGLAMGWATIGFQGSAMLLLPAFAFVLDRYGLPGALNAVAACLVALALVCAIFIRDHPEQRNCTPDNDKGKSLEEYKRLHDEAIMYQKTGAFTVKRLLRTKEMWQIGAVMGLMQLAVSGLIVQFIPKIMETGVKQDTALMIYSAAAVIGGVFSYLWGVLDQKVGTKRTTALASATHGIAALACAAAGTLVHSFAWVCFAALLVAINLGVSSNLLGSFTVTVFGRYDFSSAFTPIYMVTCGIRSLSFLIVGMLYAATGAYLWPYLATALCAFLAMVCTFFINDRCLGRVG